MHFKISLLSLICGISILYLLDNIWYLRGYLVVEKKKIYKQ